jgi:mono/diheme cytochrome c family protein
MRRIRKWIARIVGTLLVLVVLVFGFAWFMTDRGMSRTYVVNDPPLTLPADAGSLAHGKHLFMTRGCLDCHGADGAGKLVFDGGPVFKLVGPNITSGGRLKNLSADQVAASIRHGVKADGHPMVFMPVQDFHEMGDTDTAALIAYLKSLPASTNNPGDLEIRPMGMLLYTLGKLPLYPAADLDHSPRERVAPPMAATAAYGEYIAQGCTGCHGTNLAGQHVPGTPPSFPDSQNLTPAALSEWSEADFSRALRQGKRPDGSDINPFMPWQAFAQMTDVEVGALWAYLQTLPPVASKKP